MRTYWPLLPYSFLPPLLCWAVFSFIFMDTSPVTWGVATRGLYVIMVMFVYAALLQPYDSLIHFLNERLVKKAKDNK